MKWEYTWTPGRRKELHDMINIMGQQGWEAYNVTEETTMSGMTTGNYTVWLKRPIQEKEQDKNN